MRVLDKKKIIEVNITCNGYDKEIRGSQSRMVEVNEHQVRVDFYNDNETRMTKLAYLAK